MLQFLFRLFRSASSLFSVVTGFLATLLYFFIQKNAKLKADNTQLQETLREVNTQLKKWLLSKRNKPRLRHSLLLIGMLFMSGCTDSVTRTNTDTLTLKALPIFPAPKSQIVSELKQVCPKDKYHALYDWLGKLMVFQKQLNLYETEMIKGTI